jgi:hypothetical protein
MIVLCLFVFTLSILVGWLLFPGVLGNGARLSARTSLLPSLVCLCLWQTVQYSRSQTVAMTTLQAN